MADLSRIARELSGKKNLRENFTVFCRETGASFERLQKTNLAFSVLMLSETLAGNDFSNDPDIQTFFTMLSEYAAGKLPDAEKLQSLRETNTAACEDLTHAIDLYETAEYVLNRLEHRFVAPLSLPASYSDLTMTDALLSKIAAVPNDSQRSVILEIMAELPVRTTKARFYDILSERLSIYAGNDRSAFLNVCEMLRSVAGLSKVTRLPEWEELERVYQALSRADFAELTAADFENFRSDFSRLAERLNLLLDFRRSYENALNALLSLSLCGELSHLLPLSRCGELSAVLQDSLDAAVFKIISESQLILKDPGHGPEAAYEACNSLEGILEETGDEIEREKGILLRISERLSDEAGSLGFSRAFELLRILSAISSDSAFVNPFETHETEDLISKAEVTEGAEALIADFSALFETLPRRFVRAVMARAFTILPPHFSSQEELEEAIYSALSACSDEAEKIGCIEILSSILGEA